MRNSHAFKTIIVIKNVSCFCIYLKHDIITYSLNSLVTRLGLFDLYLVFYYISNIYYISSLSAHNDWTVRMMHDVVTD